MEAALIKAGVSAGTAATAATVAGHAMTGISLLQQVRSGYAQEASLQQQSEGVKEQAQAAKLKAQEESNLRRERLLNALAAQNVQAGAGGIKGGTVEQMRLQSTKEFEKEQRGADLMAKAEQSGFARKAEGLRQEGKTLRRGSLISTGLKLAEIG